MKRLGFTLVEMLVVIAIIGIMVGLIMPNLARVRSKGTSTQCQSRLKQLHTAVLSYAADSGHYPLDKSYIDEFDRVHTAWIHWLDDEDEDSYGYRGVNGETNIRNGTLWPYLNNQIKVYACPLHVKDGQGTEPVVRSYAMNHAVGWAYVLTLRDATQTIMFGEVTETRLGNAVDGSRFSTTNDLAFRHNDKAHVIYCDGHLKALPQP
jgi:prepilin-type N-terminal cleavage/methylation domain-containing protein/prepilin-type processing-associated H-X9-DG protein